MKKYQLNKEEEKILKDFESGKYKSISNVEKEKGKYQQYAKKTLSKSRNINIRISDRDLQRIKAIAAEKGLPYQTFISSLLHQYTSRSLRAREELNDRLAE
jgi:predicted DNA binding CopG/RHH family protein